MKVLLTAVLINALHATLEDAVVAFKRIGVNIAATIFAHAVIDVFVAREILTQMRVLTSFAGHDGSFLGDVGTKDRHKMRGRRTANMKAANRATAFDQR